MIKVKYFKERRLGIERRSFTYSYHIPERRSGKDPRGKNVSVIRPHFPYQNIHIDRDAA